MIRLTEHRLNILKVLHYDLNSLATGSQIRDQYKKIYSHTPGNVWDDLIDLCTLGLVQKDAATKTYSATEKGRQLLSVKCGDPPKIEMVYQGVLINKIILSDALFTAIRKEAEKEKQPIEEWVMGVLELAAGVEDEKQ